MFWGGFQPFESHQIGAKGMTFNLHSGMQVKICDSTGSVSFQTFWKSMTGNSEHVQSHIISKIVLVNTANNIISEL